MSYSRTNVRTSMSLDSGTLGVLDSLAKRWAVSKAEVMRRAIRKMKEEVEAEDKRPSPLQALEWLQSGAGLSLAEGAEFKANLEEERQAKRYWWES
ncbi:MAG: ribbon-helix-helix protein, CopG family [Akkermansiaceae bacterium]